MVELIGNPHFKNEGLIVVLHFLLGTDLPLEMPAINDQLKNDMESHSADPSHPHTHSKSKE